MIMENLIAERIAIESYRETDFHADAEVFWAAAGICLIRPVFRRQWGSSGLAPGAMLPTPRLQPYLARSALRCR